MDAEFYVKDGKDYDRVTSIVNYLATPDYLNYVVKVGKREAKRAQTVAMKIGTQVDEWIKADISGQELPRVKSDEVKAAIDGYLLWKREYDLPLAVGHTHFDEVYRIAGTPDILSANTVIDIKCSLNIRPTYWLQTAAYCHLTGFLSHGILRLDKHLGTYEYQHHTVSVGEFEAFFGLLKAYRFFKQSLTEGREEEDVTDTNSTDTEAGSKEGLE